MQTHSAAPPLIAWGIIAAIVLVALYLLAPETRIELLHWKLALIVIGSYSGWLLDRMLFPYARPADIEEPLPRIIAQCRLAFMVVGAIWAMSWGL